MVEFKLGLIIALLMPALCWSTVVQAQNRCDSVFRPTNAAVTSPDPQLKSRVVSTLFINGSLVPRGSQVTINRHRYEILDWNFTKEKKLLTVRSVRYGAVRTIDAKEIPVDFYSVKEVRLKDLLSYKNDRVIERFVRDHGVTRAEAEKTFEELMKWFYLHHRYVAEGLISEDSSGHFRLGMYDETQRIDDMWHEFILFTIDYHEFGYKYLGYYQHHQPFDRIKPLSPEETIADRMRMYQFIRDCLGADTLRSWYETQDFVHPEHPPRNHISPAAVLRAQ